jgi:hypothetical protein
MNACPSADELRRFLEGEHTTLNNSCIVTHVEHCQEWQETIDRLTRGCLAPGEEWTLAAADAARGPSPQETK